MNPKFFSLPQEKQQTILNAGFHVFSRNSYRKSPMSEIADAAGISKSLLFHYFRNKKELYLFLWDTCAKITVEEMERSGTYEQTDLFGSMEYGMQAKLSLMRRYPDIGVFAVRAFYEKDPEVSSDIQKSMGRYLAVHAEKKLQKLDPKDFILFVPMFIAGFVMMYRNPELLKKRLSAKEQESEQRTVILYSGIMFLAAFISAGMSFRFGWLMLPFRVSIIASVVFLIAYAVYAEVLRENTYLSRTVEVQEDQKVIDTGLYGIVRHPMYTATVLLFLSMPLVLGSVISFVIMLCYIPIIVKRMRNEELVLEEGLPGYREYIKKVKYRLIPFIW